MYGNTSTTAPVELNLIPLIYLLEGDSPFSIHSIAIYLTISRLTP